MKISKAIFWLSLVILPGFATNASIPQIEGQWITEYQIVDVSNSSVTDPTKLKALRMWIGHKYGWRNCVKAGDPSNLLQSAYPWDSRAKPALQFNEFGGFAATNRYFGGFAIPGHGTETIVGVIEGNHLKGIVDIDLDWEGGTHIRSVLTATRSATCG